MHHCTTISTSERARRLNGNIPKSTVCLWMIITALVKNLNNLIRVYFYTSLMLNMLQHTYHHMDHIRIHPSPPLFSSFAPPRGRTLKADQRSWRYIVWLHDRIKEVHLTYNHTRNQTFKAFSSRISPHDDSDQRLACYVWLQQHRTVNYRLALI